MVALACVLTAACEPSAEVGAEPVVTPEVEAARAELGRLLFYDPILSSDGEVACATCHSEHWGMGDGLARPIGVGAGLLVGPGRVGDTIGRRNAPTLWNVAARRELFWDGRSRTLEEQALSPFDNELELALPVEDAVAAIAGVPEYGELFGRAFEAAPSPIAEATLAAALAAFQRTLLSSHAPYDAYLDGDDGALSATMREGLDLLGELECVGCHEPPLFQSDRYAVRLEGSDDDLGRYEVSGARADRGAFRVPTLRNARDTAPYFHDGSVATLREAVAIEVDNQVAAGHRQLDDRELDVLTELISKGLRDLSRNPDRPDRVPSGLPIPRDGFRIPR